MIIIKNKKCYIPDCQGYIISDIFVLCIVILLLTISCKTSHKEETHLIFPQDRLKIISSEPMFWSRLGYTQDPTRLDTNGKPLFMDNKLGEWIEANNAFEQAGIKVFTGILHNGWIGVDKYNYTATDITIDSLLKNHPDRLYLPRIKLNVPIEWAFENLEELFVCLNGPRNKEEISRVARKMEKYWWTSGWRGNPPNDEGRIGLQSFSSQKWRKDAGEALRRLLNHLENGPYADRIIGYHIAFGLSGECASWGGFNYTTELKGDFGINHHRVFYDWCINRYGSLQSLRKAWDMPGLDYNNFEIPSPKIMESDNTTLESFFRIGGQGQYCIDYTVFTSEITVDAIEYFGRIVKEETNGKPAGVFYGYLLGSDSPYAGHLAIDKLLKSPYIDFLSSPKMYYRSEAGWPGGEQSPSLSISRKKIWIDELDNRTHLSNPDAGYLANGMDDTRTILWREVSKNLSYNNQNFWWMDLRGGWFDDKEIMDEISKLYQVNKMIRKREWKSISEILFVIDDNSFTVQSDNYGFVYGNKGGWIPELETEFKLTGAPVDTYRLCDLEDIDLSRYKLIVFANAFLFAEGQWERIRKRIPETSTVIWNYAAGIRNPNFSWDNVKKVTGFSISACPSSAINGYSGYNIRNDFPLIKILPEPELIILDKYLDGSIMAAAIKNRQGGKSILCAYPSLKAVRLREFALEAGCHLYAPANCTVYADSRFISVFPKEEIHGILKLKKQCSLKELITGSQYEDFDAVPLNMPQKSAAFFIVND